MAAADNAGAAEVRVATPTDYRYPGEIIDLAILNGFVQTDHAVAGKLLRQSKNGNGRFGRVETYARQIAGNGQRLGCRSQVAINLSHNVELVLALIERNQVVCFLKRDMQFEQNATRDCVGGYGT